jgi:hypothetical protein
MNNSHATNPEEQFSELIAAAYEDAAVQLCLAAVHLDDGPPAFEKVQLSPEVASEFQLILARQMRLLEKRMTRADLRLLKYDAGAMNRPDEIEYLTLANEPDIRDQFAALSSLGKLPVFDAGEGFVNSLHFYVIVAEFDGRRAFFFRFYSPQNELSRSSFLGLRFSNTVFNKVHEPTFLFDSHVDCIAFRDVLYILNKNNFQRIFRYFERLRAAGREALKILSARVKIENFDAFNALCEGQLNMMAKLKNIVAKEYLQRVTMKDIKRVIREFKLAAKIVKTDGEERLLFDSASKDKWLILRILDDDYLGSIMTKLKYEATSKRRMS